jgi:hypothetical protein
MADRSSRKQSRKRAKAVKRPDLRKSHVAVAGESRAVRDERKRQQRREQVARQQVKRRKRMLARPADTRGLVTMVVTGAALAGLVVLLGSVLRRWGVYGSSIESLWLYVAGGAMVAAAPVGAVAREDRDVTSFAAFMGGLATAALLIEAATFPSCPTGASCGAFGALAQMGVAWSVVLLLVLVGATWGIGTLVRGFLDKRRANPMAGTATFTDMLSGMFLPLVIISLPVLATFLAVDVWKRPAPGRAKTAVDAVERSCFSDFAAIPKLAVRPDPDARNLQAENFLVRIDGEHRPEPRDRAAIAHDKAAAKGKAARAKVPLTQTYEGDWMSRPDASPYEATASVYDSTTITQCRQIAPAGERATAADVAPLDQTSLQSESAVLQGQAASLFTNGDVSQFIQTGTVTHQSPGASGATPVVQPGG